MKKISTLGLAAVLALGVSGAAMAQNATGGMSAGGDITTGAGTDEATKLPIKPGVDAGASADVGVDAMTTGSISNQGNLVSSIQTSSDFDLSAYNDSTTVNCVTVSSLQGDAQGNASALDNAATGNPAISTLRTDIEANSALMTKLEGQCQVAEFDLQDVVFVDTGADGALTFYYDDRG